MNGNHIFVDNYPSDKRNSISANTYPIFPLTPIIATARLTEAVTATDGSGNLTSILTGGENGTLIERVTFINSQITAAISSANIGKLFISDNTGANFKPFAEIVLAAATRSTTAIGARQQFITGGLILPKDCILACCITIYAGEQDQTDVIVEGGNY